jgi:hypothetical protein
MGTTPGPLPLPPVAPGVEEAGLDDDLLLRIALRPVEPGGGLGQPEDVADAVVADAVAGAEIAVRGVVEGAPGDAARVTGVARELVVHAQRGG